jgi:hypothetical protein
MSERDVERAGDAPSDTEALVGDTAASDPPTDRQRVSPTEAASRDSLATTPDSAVSPRGDGREGVEQVLDAEPSDPALSDPE